MMNVLLIVALGVIVVSFVLRRPGQREFGGLSEQQLRRCIAYAAMALADGGWICVRRTE